MSSLLKMQGKKCLHIKERMIFCLDIIYSGEYQLYSYLEVVTYITTILHIPVADIGLQLTICIGRNK